MTLTLATWNLNARRDSETQVRAICEHRPDVVTFQEVTRHTSPNLESALIKHGLPNIVSSVGGASSGPRKYGLVIASRFPIEPLESEVEALWSERILAARLRWDHDVAVVTTHIPPGSSNGPGVKSSMLEAALRAAKELSQDLPTLISGDFNAPQEEQDSVVMTWGQRRNKQGEIVIRRTPSLVRQHLAEIAWFEDEFIDAFRTLHPTDDAFSWVLKRSAGDVPRRFDHVFVNPRLRPLTAQYDLSFLQSGLSDHAPLIVTVRLAEERFARSEPNRANPSQSEPNQSNPSQSEPRV